MSTHWRVIVSNICQMNSRVWCRSVSETRTKHRFYHSWSTARVIKSTVNSKIKAAIPYFNSCVGKKQVNKTFNNILTQIMISRIYLIGNIILVGLKRFQNKLRIYSPDTKIDQTVSNITRPKIISTHIDTNRKLEKSYNSLVTNNSFNIQSSW